MKKTTWSVYLLFIVLNGFAQKIPDVYRKKYFKNCCAPQKTTIRSILEIDGYYSLSFINKESNTGGVIDTNEYKILFYENGLCVSGWAIYAKTIRDVHTEIEQIIRNGSKDWFYKTAAWGKYEINSDTIIARNIVYGTLMRPANVWETRYKIINRTTIVQIDEKSLRKTGKQQRQKSDRNKVIYLPANFQHLQSVPISDYSWLMRQKSVTCD